MDTIAAVAVRTASITIQHCNFYGNTGSGIFIARVVPQISNNNFSGNLLDVSTYAESLPALSGNVPITIGLISMQDDAVLVRGNIFYRILQNITIPAGKTLTIEPGTTVQFTEYDDRVPTYNSSQLTVLGVLKAEGTATDSIRFVSDRKYGGTYRYTTGPIFANSTAAGNIMKYVSVDGVGFRDPSSEFFSFVQVTSPSFFVQNCSFRNISGSGVSLRVANPQLNDFRPQITDSYFSTTKVGIVIPLERVFKISGNTGDRVGVFNDSNNPADIRLTKNHRYQAIDRIRIVQGRTLTIDPGVDWLLPVPTENVVLRIDGSLIAEGTSAEPIQLRSVLRTLSGNGAITFEATSVNNLLKWVQFDEWGYTPNINYRGVIYNRSPSFSMQNCSMTRITGSGVETYVNATLPSMNNQFQTSDMDVILNPDNLRNWSGNGALKVGIGLGGTLLTVGASILMDDTIYAGHQVYRFLEPITIPKNRTMTIEPGVRIEFRPGYFVLPGGAVSINGTRLTVQGTLIAKGTPDKPIQMVAGSRSDPVQDAGVANGSVVIDTTSQNSMLQYLQMDKLGDGSSSGLGPLNVLTVNTPSCTIDHLTIQNTNSTGLLLRDAGSLVISSSCFLNNSKGGVLINSGTPQFVNCNFVNNYAYGLNNTSSNIVDAKNCWWGNASGPNQYQTNPTGTGDIISNNVVYAPWSTTAFACTASVSLPLTLTDFSVASQSGSVQCSWQTASEFNTSHFLIQRSPDGSSFSDVGRVNAAGQSSVVLRYSYLDPSPAAGISYYRLKMVDKDGSFTYSKVLTINVNISSLLAIFPNPVKESLNVQIRNRAAGQVTIQLLNMQGVVLQQRSQRLQAGTTTVSFNTTGLARGMYVLSIKGDQTERRTFVVE